MSLQNLPDADQRLEAIFQAFGDLLFILSEDGTILDHKSGDTAYLYLSPAQFLGRKIQEVYPYKVGRKYTDAIAGLRSDKKIGFIEYSLPMIFGEGWFEARLVLLANRQIIVCIRDITKHKQSEIKIDRQLQQIAALRAIDLAITTNLDLTATLSVILGHVRAQLNIDAASILLFDQRTHFLEFAAGMGFTTSALQHTRLRVGEEYAGKSVSERKVFYVPDLRASQTAFLRSPFLAQENFIAYYAIPLFAKGQAVGVLEIFHRALLDADMDWLNYMNTLAGQAAIAIDNAMLFKSLQSVNYELSLAYDKTIEGWSRAINLRDKETEEHSRRVTNLTCKLANQMGVAPSELVHIYRGAMLHDIGKVAIPDNILLKPGPLNEEEWVIMRCHPQIAVELLASIEHLAPALDIPRSHHEKWNGKGYPDQLAGEDIPLAARLFAVVDVYDALTSDRPYRTAWSKTDTLEYIHDNSGIHFDPKVVLEFASMIAD